MGRGALAEQLQHWPGARPYWPGHWVALAGRPGGPGRETGPHWEQRAAHCAWNRVCKTGQEEVRDEKPEAGCGKPDAPGLTEKKTFMFYMFFLSVSFSRHPDSLPSAQMPHLALHSNEVRLRAQKEGKTACIIHQSHSPTEGVSDEGQTELRNKRLLKT